MKELAKYGDYIFYLSLVGLALAAYGSLAGNDIWLAPTQWIMVATLTGVYATYLKASK